MTSPIARNKFKFYIFSGTGNTLWTIKILAEELGKYGFKTELDSLPCPTPGNLDENTVLCIAFPVYAQTAPPFVSDWIRNLPDPKTGTPVIVISTLAGMSGLVKGPFYHILKDKGYTPLAVREFIMPANYIHQSSDEKTNIKIMNKAADKIANFAKEISEGKVSWPRSSRILLMFQALGILFFKHIVAAWLGRGFSADKKKCVKCGQCIKMCPVSNISPDPEYFPVWGRNCQQCLRCINYCPHDAIDNRKIKYIFHPKYKCPGIPAIELMLKKD